MTPARGLALRLIRSGMPQAGCEVVLILNLLIAVGNEGPVLTEAPPLRRPEEGPQVCLDAFLIVEAVPDAALKDCLPPPQDVEPPWLMRSRAHLPELKKGAQLVA